MPSFTFNDPYTQDQLARHVATSFGSLPFRNPTEGIPDPQPAQPMQEPQMKPSPQMLSAHGQQEEPPQSIPEEVKQQPQRHPRNAEEADRFRFRDGVAQGKYDPNTGEILYGENKGKYYEPLAAFEYKTQVWQNGNKWTQKERDYYNKLRNHGLQRILMSDEEYDRLENPYGRVPEEVARRGISQEAYNFYGDIFHGKREPKNQKVFEAAQAIFSPTYNKKEVEYQEGQEAKIASIRDANRRVEDMISSLDYMQSVLDEFSLLPTTGWGNKLLGDIPGTNAQKFDIAFKTLASQGALKELAALKLYSAQGASGLGALSDKEREMLQRAAIGALDPRMDEESVRALITGLRKKLDLSRREYGDQLTMLIGGGKNSSAAARPVGEQQGQAQNKYSNMSDEELMQRYREMKARRAGGG